jgi:hypothetical protein
VEKARTEIEFITNELAMMYGVNQSLRHRDAEIERARKTVTNRIRNAFTKIQRGHPELWRHLFTTIKTGTFCSYTPEKPTFWEL